MQQEFFSNQVTLTKKNPAIKSKAQKLFDSLLNKVQKRQTELENTRNLLDGMMQQYASDIKPLTQAVCESRTEWAILLHACFIRERHNEKNGQGLAALIREELQEIFRLSGEEPSVQLKQIFLDIEGITYEQAADEDQLSMMEAMEESLRDLGMNINLSELDPNMNFAEMEEKLKQLNPEFEAELDALRNSNNGRKKTKKQLEKEDRLKQAELLKDKSISDIYKQLAKALHPDLELDPIMKMEKDELMKQLTVAYENRDLFTLLRLELQWLKKEESNLDGMAEDTLKIYCELLKQQIANIEHDIEFADMHPKYDVLSRLLPMPVSIVHLSMKDLVSEFKFQVKMVNEFIEMARNSKSSLPKHIREQIKEANEMLKWEANMYDDGDDF